ncbi:GrpB family protein [Metabacillus dongyingensis]|nr:GrpB family protein [Metabacillus dongyingensis]
MGFTGRCFFRKGQGRTGTHHLHIYEYKSEFWINNIFFRNYLIDNSDIKLQYNELKRIYLCVINAIELDIQMQKLHL